MRDHGRVLDAVVWIARSDARWRDLPVGNANSGFRRFRRQGVRPLGPGALFVAATPTSCRRSTHQDPGAKDPGATPRSRRKEGPIATVRAVRAAALRPSVTSAAMRVAQPIGLQVIAWEEARFSNGDALSEAHASGPAIMPADGRLETEGRQ